MISGSAILASHEVATRETCMKDLPLWVAHKLPTFPPLHMGWSNRFRMLSLKVCSNLSVLKGDNSGNRGYPHTSALPHSSQVDRSDTQESLCCRVGGFGRKNAIALYGNLAASPGWSYKSRHRDCRCPAGPRGGVPKLCPNASSGHDASSPKTQP
jgi:hypothetical protein